MRQSVLFSNRPYSNGKLMLLLGAGHAVMLQLLLLLLLLHAVSNGAIEPFSAHGREGPASEVLQLLPELWLKFYTHAWFAVDGFRVSACCRHLCPCGHKDVGRDV